MITLNPAVSQALYEENDSILQEVFPNSVSGERAQSGHTQLYPIQSFDSRHLLFTRLSRNACPQKFLPSRNIVRESLGLFIQRRYHPLVSLDPTKIFHIVSIFSILSEVDTIHSFSTTIT
jgi:hypothetical protein